MNKIFLLLGMLMVGLVSSAHMPSPLAQKANVDSDMIYGDKDSFQRYIKKYGDLAANAGCKDDAARFAALQAEFYCFAGQPEESLRIYKQLIGSFSDEVSGYTRLSVMCSALQTAIDLGIIVDVLPYVDSMDEILAQLSSSSGSDESLLDYFKLTSLLLDEFVYDVSAIKECDTLADHFMQKYGPRSPQYAILRKISGNVYAAFDRRSHAAMDFDDALSIWNDGKPSVEKFSLYLGMAALYCELSDFNRAKQCLDDAEDTLSALGLSHSYYGVNLAEMKCTYYVDTNPHFSDTNAWSEILAHCNNAEALSKEIFGTGHITARRFGATKALATMWTDNPYASMGLLSDIIADTRFAASRMGNDYLVALSLYTTLCSVIAPDKVQSLYESVEENLFRQCPRKHSITYNFYEAWGLNLLDKSNYKGAVEKYQTSFESSRKSLHSSLSFLSESDRSRLIKDIYHYQDNMFSLGAAPTGESNVAPLLFDNAMFIKSIMMHSVASLKHQVESLPASATEAHSLLDSFLALKRKRLHGEEVADADLTAAEQRLLKHLENHPEYGDYLEFLFNDWTHVEKKLGEKDAVVEFIVSEENSKGIRDFSAEVLRKGERPRHVRLFSMSDSDKHLLNTDKGEFNKFVRDSIWTSDLLSILPAGGNVYFVPTAELYGMALEFIPVGKDNSPISDLYNMVRLSSSRELVADFSDRPISDGCTAAIYGGLNYNTALDDMELYALEANERGHRGSSLWQILPGTHTEAKNVAEALSIYNPRLITGDEGVEETFKALDGTKTSIIHIATHGFYNPADDKDPESALDRTGLIMSGANNYWLTQQAPIGIDDGVLTAREIADLDLRGTDMVVLSACQSGLGDVSGEGVFGLQRAFKMAGAKSILMSLWPVNDDATQVLMSDFYRNLASGMPKRKALNEARHSLGRHSFSVDGVERPGSDPQFSAAFVLLD